jgi:nucleoside-diphosphate-sugar epimerase
MLQTILGANGTIASLLAKELRQYTSHIRLVSRNPRKVNETDELVKADLSDPLAVASAIEGSSIVYLMVGFEYSVKVWEEKWPKLMRATIDACIKNKAKLVFFDNVYLYDLKAIPSMTENSAVNPPSKKGKVRRMIADMMMSEIAAGRLQGLIARAADFYGPHNEKSFLIETVYKNFQKGKKANWFVDPGKIHSFTYTPDAAKATALLGNTPDAYNQVWHLPTSHEKLTGKDFIKLFSKEMGVPNKHSTLPVWLLKALGWFIPLISEMPEMMYQYDRDYYFDSSKFKKRFGISATPYELGVKETVLAGKAII